MLNAHDMPKAQITHNNREKKTKRAVSYICSNETTEMAFQNTLITSRVSGRGHRIGAVCVSVCLSTLSRQNRLTYDLDVFVCVCLNP